MAFLFAYGDKNITDSKHFTPSVIIFDGPIIGHYNFNNQMNFIKLITIDSVQYLITQQGGITKK